MRVLRCGSKVVCRKPRLQAADPTLKEIVKLVLFEDGYMLPSPLEVLWRINIDDYQPLKRAISIPGLVNAFLMLGFTAFLQQYVSLE